MSAETTRIPVTDGYALTGHGLYEIPFLAVNARTGEQVEVVRVERDYIEVVRSADMRRNGAPAVQFYTPPASQS